MSHLFTGFIVWLLLIGILWLIISRGHVLAKNPVAFKREMDSLINDILDEDHIAIVCISGLVGVIIIIGWPVLGVMLGIAVIGLVIGGIPYLIIRSLKNKTK